MARHDRDFQRLIHGRRQPRQRFGARLPDLIVTLLVGGVMGFVAAGIYGLYAGDKFAGRDRSAERYFANCGEARDAGAAPMERGEPGYRAGLDADGDGEACEPYPGL